MPSEHIFAGLDILTDVLKNPTFEQDKFDKEKNVILEEIKMYHDSPRHDVLMQIEKMRTDLPREIFDSNSRSFLLT